MNLMPVQTIEFLAFVVPDGELPACLIQRPQAETWAQLSAIVCHVEVGTRRSLASPSMQAIL